MQTEELGRPNPVACSSSTGVRILTSESSCGPILSGSSRGTSGEGGGQYPNAARKEKHPRALGRSRRRRVLMSSCGEETGDEEESPRPTAALSTSVVPSPTSGFGTTKNTIPASESQENPPVAFSPEIGQWLKQVLEGIAKTSKGDTYECLARLATAYPRLSYEAMSRLDREAAVARSAAMSRHRWRGALPSWHPLVLGGGRAAGRAAALRMYSSSGRKRGKYTGVSSGGESDDESSQGRSINLLTEDEESTAEFSGRVDWVVATQAALVNYDQNSGDVERGGATGLARGVLSFTDNVVVFKRSTVSVVRVVTISQLQLLRRLSIPSQVVRFLLYQETYRTHPCRSRLRFPLTLRRHQWQLCQHKCRRHRHQCHHRPYQW